MFIQKIIVPLHCNIAIKNKQRRCPRLKGISFIGYTHYWTFKREKTTDNTNFAKAVEEIKTIHSRLPKRTNTAGGSYPNHHVKIMGGNGYGLPKFTPFEVKGNAVVVTTSSDGDKTTFTFDDAGDLIRTSCNC